MSGAGRIRSSKGQSEQTRAKQHQAGCGYHKESIGHEITIAHGTTRSFRRYKIREDNALSRYTVKEIPSGRRNLNRTDDLEQQWPQSLLRHICVETETPKGRHDRAPVKNTNKIK
jgi:hypothetical protein